MDGPLDSQDDPSKWTLAVKSHVTNISQKLEVNYRTGAVTKAMARVAIKL